MPLLLPIRRYNIRSNIQPNNTETGFEMKTAAPAINEQEIIHSKTESVPTHYLDTLAVYKQLVSAGFSDVQARRIIEITEKNLGEQLEKVLQWYAPKSDLENENYLFHAASSELSVEVKRLRELHLNELRSNINMLDRELNLVTDELKELMVACKNDSEVAVNDHKLENALLDKQLKIQVRELENRINLELITEVKFGVESLRWSLTRRGIFCILAVAASVLITVTGSKVVSQIAEDVMGGESDEGEFDSDLHGPLVVSLHDVVNDEK